MPIYRKPPAGKEVAGSNEDSFERCYEYLGEGRVILIFPEGQSHSDPSLRPLKTGAARLALGHRERHGELPRVLPVGLTFSRKGRFRGNVLIELGAPIPFAPASGKAETAEPAEEQVRRYTEEIELGLERVTVNADSWEDVALLDLLQRFFTLRATAVKEAGAKGKVALADKYRSLRRLIEGHRALRAVRPAEVEQLRLRLKRFDKLRRRFGVEDYQLHLEYRFATVLLFLGRTLLWGLLIFPLALWGCVFSGLPYLATRALAGRFARGRDQVDTASLLIGLFLFPLAWAAETAVVDLYFGWQVALTFGLLLPPTAGIALKLGHERKKIQEEIRVFWMFSRRREIQTWLRQQRAELEVELARIARLAREAVGPVAGREHLVEAAHGIRRARDSNCRSWSRWRSTCASGGAAPARSGCPVPSARIDAVNDRDRRRDHCRLIGSNRESASFSSPADRSRRGHLALQAIGRRGACG